PASGLRSRHGRSDRRRRHVRARGHHDGPRERPSHRRDRNTGAERQDIPRSTPRAISGSYRANRKALVTRRPTANTRTGRLTTIQLDRRTSTAGPDGPRAPARELPGWPAATKRPVGRGAINRRLTEPRAAPNLAVTAASRKLEGERARMKEADSQSTRFEHLISELNHPAAGSLSRPNAT